MRSSVPNQALALGGELMWVAAVFGNRCASPYRAGMLGNMQASTIKMRMPRATIATQLRR